MNNKISENELKDQEEIEREKYRIYFKKYCLNCKFYYFEDPVSECNNRIIHNYLNYIAGMPISEQVIKYCSDNKLYKWREKKLPVSVLK